MELEGEVKVVLQAIQCNSRVLPRKQCKCKQRQMQKQPSTGAAEVGRLRAEPGCGIKPIHQSQRVSGVSSGPKHFETLTELLPSLAIRWEEVRIIMHISSRLGLVQVHFEIDPPIHPRYIAEPLVEIRLVGKLVSTFVDWLLVRAQG